MCSELCSCSFSDFCLLLLEFAANLRNVSVESTDSSSGLLGLEPEPSLPPVPPISYLIFMVTDQQATWKQHIPSVALQIQQPLELVKLLVQQAEVGIIKHNPLW